MADYSCPYSDLYPRTVRFVLGPVYRSTLDSSKVEEFGKQDVAHHDRALTLSPYLVKVGQNDGIY